MSNLRSEELEVGGEIGCPLTEPLLVHFYILMVYAASSGDMLTTLTIANGCNVCIGHLSTLNCQFQWNVVLQYHKAYFLSWHHEMARGDYSEWLHSDVLLMNEHFYGHPHIQNYSGPLKGSQSATNSTKQPVAAQTCFAFNKKTCTSSPCLMVTSINPRSVMHLIMVP